MSTVTHTIRTVQDPELFREWAAAHAASWDAMIANAQQTDTWAAMVDASVDYEDICDAHRRIARWRAPDLPAGAWPDWAVRGVVKRQAGGRDVSIFVYGEADGTDHGARLETYYSVCIAADPTGEYALGDYDIHGPQVDWPANLEALDLDDARSLRDSLTALLATLDTPENE